MPVKFQRLESVAILIALIFLFYELQFSWVLFALFILAPDVFMLGYLKNSKIGAVIYNIGHSYLMPVILWLFSQVLTNETLTAIAIIWAAHIAADRTFGFGLKFPNGFKNTHLGNLK